MRKIARLILIPYLFFFHYLASQQKIFSYRSDNELSAYLIGTAISLDETDAFIFTLCDKNRMMRFYCSKGKTINLFEQRLTDVLASENFKFSSTIDDNLLTLYWKQSVIGGVYKDRMIVEAVRNEMNADFYLLETNLSTGASQLTDTIKSSISERMIGCFNKKGKLYLLTTRKNSNELTVYTKEPASGLKKSVLEIDVTGFGKNTNNPFKGRIDKLSDIFDKDEFAIYHNNQRYPALLSAFRDKAYDWNDQLIFTVSSNNLNTYAIVLDLKTLSYSIKIFDQDVSKEGNFSLLKTCSYLVNNKLLTCHLIKDTLNLNVFDFETGAEIRAMKINSTNIDSLITGDIEKTGNFFSKFNLSQQKLDRFLTAARNNELSISAYEENNTLFISFAAPFRQIINAATLMNIALTVGGTYVINSLPNTNGFLLSYYSVKAPTFVSFDVAIDPKTFQATKQTSNFRVWDRLHSFFSSRQQKIKNRLFFFMNGYYYVGDYLRETRTYSIYGFNEKGND